MNTIARTKDGWINIDRTVYNTIKVLAQKPGYIRIQAIQAAINTQLEPYEHISRKHIIRSLAHILERGKNT